MSATWKPCDRLTPDDFKKTPVWTYDLPRAESDDKFDETWVRPAKPGADELDDEIFCRVKLMDRDDKPVPNCVVVMRPSKRKGGRPLLSALVVLSPYYDPTPIVEGAIAPSLNAALQRRLPLTYEIDVKAGGERIEAKGKLNLKLPEPKPLPIEYIPPPPDPVVGTKKKPAKKKAASKKPPAKQKKR